MTLFHTLVFLMVMLVLMLAAVQMAVRRSRSTQEFGEADLVGAFVSNIDKDDTPPPLGHFPRQRMVHEIHRRETARGGADLAVMLRDTEKMRGHRPFVMAAVKHGQGVGEIVDFVVQAGGLGR
ncbi:MAG: hypothetical protein O7A03_08970 [Alphaproteobacteria bacterium]|nr:hypothetical protein [Alphaproteobacteria bacterium]